MFLYCLWTAEKEFKALMELSVIEQYICFS